VVDSIAEASLVQDLRVDLGNASSTRQYQLRRRYLGRRAFAVRYSGRVFEILTSLDSEWQLESGPTTRADIGGFSRRSRMRLLKLCASIPWRLFETRFFCTMTYPDDFPTDGRVVKRHLKVFRKRLERRWGKQAVVWKLEFQRRGAPHFHLLLSVSSETVMKDFQQWFSSAWYEVVGSGDLRHLLAGTQAAIADTDCGKYFAYGVKSSGSKEYQNQVPDGFQSVGRFWGSWNVKPEWKGAEISGADFVQLRRRMRAWSKANGGYVPRHSRVQGGWMLTEGRSAALVLAQLARGLHTVERVIV
jgi:hypothetical protein